MTPRCEDRPISVSQFAKAPRRSLAVQTWRWWPAATCGAHHRRVGSRRPFGFIPCDLDQRACAWRTTYASMFLFVENACERQVSETTFGRQIARWQRLVFEAGASMVFSKILTKCAVVCATATCAVALAHARSAGAGRGRARVVQRPLLSIRRHGARVVTHLKLRTRDCPNIRSMSHW